MTTRTVTELLADLRDRADIEEMSIRHTDTRLCRSLPPLPGLDDMNMP